MPSISTSVRCEPKPRRLIVEVPVEPFARLLPCSGDACGNWLRMSDVDVLPVYLMSCELMTLTGLSLVSVGEGMREPVTSIFSIFWAWAVSGR